VNGDTYIFCKRTDCYTVPIPLHTRIRHSCITAVICNCQEEQQYAYNVTWRRVRVTIVTVEKQ